MTQQCINGSSWAEWTIQICLVIIIIIRGLSYSSGLAATGVVGVPIRWYPHWERPSSFQDISVYSIAMGLIHPSFLVSSVGNFEAKFWWNHLWECRKCRCAGWLDGVHVGVLVWNIRDREALLCVGEEYSWMKLNQFYQPLALLAFVPLNKQCFCFREPASETFTPL